jgi:hypothetical protein
VEIKCSECKEIWEVGTFSSKEYGNRCPYCGNHYLKLLEALECIANSEPRPLRNGTYRPDVVENLQRIARNAIYGTHEERMKENADAQKQHKTEANDGRQMDDSGKSGNG